MHPTKGILTEMLNQCVPDLRGTMSEIAKGFVNDMKEPYETAVIELMRARW